MADRSGFDLDDERKATRRTFRGGHVDVEIDAAATDDDDMACSH